MPQEPTDHLGRARERLPEMVDDVIRLLRCESPSDDLAATARSAELVAELGERLLGAPAERIRRDGASHLWWRFGSRPRVLLLGHHDTVWPTGTLDRIPAEVTDGVLRGPGCFDMKTGVVMALHAAALAGVPDGVCILITGDEEVGSPTSRTLIEECAAGCDAVLVLEASADGGALKIARKGVSAYEVRVRGRAAHAGLEPEKGVNAAIELAHQILAVTELADAHAGTTLVPTVTTAGTTTNTVPAAASVALDVRAWTEAEQQRVHTALTSLASVVPGSRVEVDGGPNRPPLEASASATLLARADRLATRLGLGRLPTAAVGGASDGNFTAGLGIPTLDGLGAVGGGAHAEDEHVLVEEIPGRTALLAALIEDLLLSAATNEDTDGETR